MFLLRLQPVDFEDYPSGSAFASVGPFDTYKDAERWLDDNPEYTSQFRLTKGYYGWSGRLLNVDIYDPFSIAHDPSKKWGQ